MMPDPLTVILKKPVASVRVLNSSPAPAAVRPAPAPRPPRTQQELGQVHAALEAQLAAAQQQQAQQLQRLEAQLRQQVEAERAAMKSARAALESAAAETLRLREQILSGAERQVLELAVDIAGRVLLQEVQAQNYQLAPIVEAALANLPSRTDLVVKLNPADLERCGGTLPNGEGAVRYVADPGVPPAGCVVESGEGCVESDPQRQLEQVRQALVGET